MDLPIIRVNALGRLQVSIERIKGYPIPVEDWDGALPPQLFLWNIVNGVVTRDETFTAFWPELSTKGATNVYHVTKRKINERLGYAADGPQGLTRYLGQSYVLMSLDHPAVMNSGLANSMDPAHTFRLEADFLQFAAEYAALMAWQDQEKWSEGEMNLLSDAILLYKGPFLPMYQMPWIQQRRRELAKMASDLYYLYSQRTDSAFRKWNNARKAVEVAPEVRQDVLRFAMAAAVDAGEVDAGRQLYWATYNRLLPGERFELATNELARLIGAIV